MNFAFTEEQQALCEMARAFLTEHAGPAAARVAMESELGHDPKLWRRIASELGWAGAPLPEKYGGSGLGPVEVAALMERMGEALLCSPYLSTVCLAANAILLAGSDAQKSALLPGIAKGECIASLAGCDEFASATPSDADAVRWRSAGDGYRLSGVSRFVPDGHCADTLIVAAAHAEGERGDAGIALFVVTGEEEEEEVVKGLVRKPLPTMDATRRLAQIEFHDLPLAADAVLGDAHAGATDSAAHLERTLDLATVALAAEQVGGAQRCLDLAVAHAGERVQFGRTIGSFQALKHKMADMMVQVEAARSAVYYAACAAAENSRDLPRLASMAKAVASDAYRACAADALQIFGGAGFTWEYDIHLYFKRARSSAVLLGDATCHRERVARELGL